MNIIKLDERAFRLKVSQFLREYYNYSGRSLRKIEVYLDDKRIKTTFKLPKSGTLKVIEKEKISNIKPIKRKLDILFEDDDLLIINKEPFLITHPTLKKVDETLANAVVYYFKEKYGFELLPRFVSRLDMNTTGIIVIAKNAYSQSFLQLNSDKVEKKYIALVEGIVDFEEKELEANILKVDDELERIVDEKGQYAKTKFRNLKTFSNLNISMLECELFTGRTHQIRVHLKYLGFPIIGDTLYNVGSKYNKLSNRQMLHSYYYSFIHPRTEKRIVIQTDIYEDMLNILK